MWNYGTSNIQCWIVNMYSSMYTKYTLLYSMFIAYKLPYRVISFHLKNVTNHLCTTCKINGIVCVCVCEIYTLLLGVNNVWM